MHHTALGCPICSKSAGKENGNELISPYAASLWGKKKKKEHN